MRSIGYVVLAGISLLSSAAINAFISAARTRAQSHMTVSVRAYNFIGWFWYFVLLGTGFLIAVLVFTFIFKWMPHRKVFWRDAVAGALLTTVIWEIGSYIFMRVVPFFDYQRIYGKMGAMIALLAWVYTSNLIMLFGASFSARLNDLMTERTLRDDDLYLGEKLRRFPGVR